MIFVSVRPVMFALLPGFVHWTLESFKHHLVIAYCALQVHYEKWILSLT